MDVRAVRELSRLGRVEPAPDFHAGRHGIGFATIVSALERRYSVQKDLRPAGDGSLLHPDGWFALSNLPGGHRLRSEFDVVKDAQGELLLVVTAYQM